MKVSPARYAGALRSTISNRRPIRQLVRSPLEREAAALLEGLDVADLTEVTGGVTFTASVRSPDAQHRWSLHAPDQLVMQAIIAARGVRTAFEIGTFNGGTTRLIAEALPEDGRVWTLDLPPDAFDQTQSPDAFTGAQVGQAYRGSPAEHKITQLLEDSAAFDPTPYEGKCDLVLVDGGHEYQHGVTDTRTAFRLVAPGGVILWDDFQPYWHGLVRGIIETAPVCPKRLAATSLGVYVNA
jgi:predicted O-methyltransferase YrrM